MKNKGKKLFACIVGVILIFLLGIVLYKSFFGKVEVIDFDKDEISRVCITNGNNGNITELTTADINVIYNDLKDVYVKPINVEESCGWLYYIDFFVGDEVTRIVMCSQSIWAISDREYTVSSEISKKLEEDIITIEKAFFNEGE